MGLLRWTLSFRFRDINLVPSQALCTTPSSDHYELLGVPQPGEANDPHLWANRKLFDPPEAESFCDLVSKHLGWVKKLIRTSEKGVCKGLMSIHPNREVI